MKTSSDLQFSYFQVPTRTPFYLSELACGLNETFQVPFCPNKTRVRSFTRCYKKYNTRSSKSNFFPLPSHGVHFIRKDEFVKRQVRAFEKF